MSIIAEFGVPSDEFALYETLVAVPEMIVEIERVVAHESDRIMPLFWTRGDNHADFEDAAADDPSVEDITKLDETDDAVLYRAEWVENVETVAYAYTETGATITEATGQNDRWNLQMRFDDEASLSTFRECLDENGYQFDLNALYREHQPMTESHEVTAPQRDALLCALDAGFYNVPRDTTMDDVAADLGISQQALSKRLRRGYRNLIESSLTLDHPDDSEE
ncbi:helix-turn-helix domain-containing protein [Halalkalicoccus salilacus]|uniref:helix-turn-helix domain-containing protein n=1 Tax=Halalkalicoccus TaxID=332246 RepID=UPI002F968EF3